MWAFGVLEADCFGAIEVDTGRTHLFVPLFPPSYEVWMGPSRTLEAYAIKYGIENVHYSKDVCIPTLQVFSRVKLMCFRFLLF